MNLKDTATKVLVEPKWKVLWYFTNSLWAGITLYILASYGYVFWSPNMALIVGFFTPLVVYTAKEALGLFKYKRRLGEFWYMDRQYERAMQLFHNQEWEKALALFSLILKVGPDHKRALYYAAVCNEKLGNWSDVVTMSRHYLKQNPEDDEVSSMLTKANQNLWNEE